LWTLPIKIYVDFQEVAVGLTGDDDLHDDLPGSRLARAFQEIIIIPRNHPARSNVIQP
jgi:hypothetical protein